jgi:uncharacterized protein YqgV (UPF0045/DUF77 family)
VFTVCDGKTLLEGSPTRVIQHVKQDDEAMDSHGNSSVLFVMKLTRSDTLWATLIRL